MVSDGDSVDRPSNLQFVQEQLAKLIQFLEIKELPSDATEAKVVLSHVLHGRRSVIF